MNHFTVTLEGPGVTPVLLSKDVSNLRFKKILRGGFASVTFDLRRPLNAEKLSAFSRVTVRNAAGTTVGAGRLMNPGQGRSGSGDVYQVSALGEGLAAMLDRQEPYILIDHRPDAWHQSKKNTKNATYSHGEEPDGSSEEGVLLDLEGNVGVGRYSELLYNDVFEIGHHIAAVEGQFTAGRSDANNRITAWAQVHGGSEIIFNTVGPPSGSSFSSTSIRTFDGYVTTDWNWAVDKVNKIFLRYDRLTSLLASGEDDWAHLTGLGIQAIRYGRDRQPIIDPLAYSGWDVKLHEIVIDVWARLCPTIDVANAEIVESFLPLEQIAFTDAISPYDIFEQVMQIQTDLDWAVWERQENGLHRAEFRTMPPRTTIRYEVSDFVDFQRTGNDDEGTFNRYVVIGTRQDGRPSVAHVAIADDSLTAAGLTRSRGLTLGGNWDEGDANDLANAASVDDRARGIAAQITLASGQSILDRETGRFIEPYEIDPGYNLRVQGMRTEVDLMNGTASEGAKVFRTAANEFNVDDGTAVVDLNGVDQGQQAVLGGLAAFQLPTFRDSR